MTIISSKYLTGQINLSSKYLLIFAVLLFGRIIAGCNENEDEIDYPTDVPIYLSPSEAIKSFELPSGFRIELVASEPLINEPTGMCWDEKGRFYVSELHGYNLEGQLEIEAMNEKGVVDTVVQRVEADDQYKRAAEAGVFGRIKRLSDTNGDGVMDKAVLFADQLPPTYGCTAARNGLIIAGQTKIIYISDENGDGKADVRETLFQGWQDYKLERGISAPQWGMDGWIYFSSGAGGGYITGPNINEPIQLPRTDFRIRPDGSAIEPVVGGGGTIGSVFNEDGYRIFTLDSYHAYYAIPIPWKYLERNPNVSITPLTVNGANYSTVFPIAPTHPWRLVRSQDPEWRDFYLEHAGEREVTASGYFTSACCPMIYRKDDLFPAEFTGNLFVSEPAQSLVHRSVVEIDGTELRVRRGPESEQNKEFLRSTDSWFSPVGLAQAPDGSLYVSDFYREIIEDYSAVPRPMQQKYELMDGSDMGRIWRISPNYAESLDRVEQVDLTNSNLEKELDSPHYWRRKTANRLIYEQQGEKAPPLLRRQLMLSELTKDTPVNEFVNSLRRQDTDLIHDVTTARRLARISYEISNERKLLQLALSLGYSQDPVVFESLMGLARNHADIRWMPEAIMTGSENREDLMFKALIDQPGVTGKLLLNLLAESISAKGDVEDLVSVLRLIAKCETHALQIESLKGLNRNTQSIPLNEQGVKLLNTLLESDELAVREQALKLAFNLNLDNFEPLEEIRQEAMFNVINSQLTTEERLEAVALLSGFSDDTVSKTLIHAWTIASPPVKSAILESLISRDSQISTLIDAILNEDIPVSSLNSSQRTHLIERTTEDQRSKLKDLISKEVDPDKTAIYQKYIRAQEIGKANTNRGKELFQTMCASCHQAKGIGTAVGPSLDAVRTGSKEAIVRKILWPNESIASGFELHVITTSDGKKHSGVLYSESPNSLVLRQVGGNELMFLRSNIKDIKTLEATLMPSFQNVLSPPEVVDIINWLQTSL